MLHGVITLDIFPSGEPLVQGRVPPTEFRIFRKGKNGSVKGDFAFDDKAAKVVMENAEKWGNRYPIDYAHGMVKHHDGDNPAEQHKAAGWFTPEVRDGELWATNVKWTPKAEAYLKDGEYAYFSPAFDVDGEDRVKELTNIALTNVPAMKNITPLVAASKTAEDDHAPSRVEERIMASKQEMCEAIHKAHEAIHGKHYDGAHKAIVEAKLSQMSAGDMKEYCESLAKFFPDEDDKDDREESKKKDDEETEEREESRLGVDGIRVMSMVAEVTGKTDPEEAMGALMGMRDANKRLSKIEKELADLRVSKETDERQVLLSQAVKDGKISPAAAQGEGDDGKFVKSLTLSQLKGYVSTKAPVTQSFTPGNGGGSTEGVGQNTFMVDGKPVTLSKFELDLCARDKVKPENYAKTKATTPWTQMK